MKSKSRVGPSGADAPVPLADSIQQPPSAHDSRGLPAAQPQRAQTPFQAQAAPWAAKPVANDPRAIKDRVMVAVRVRPLQIRGTRGYDGPDGMANTDGLSVEKAAKQRTAFLTNVVRTQGPTVYVHDAGQKAKAAAAQRRDFTFDAVFPESCAQADIYDEIVRPLVGTCLDGYNGCVFCYGQTSSGKTFTMTGPPSQLSNRVTSDAGIILRAAEQITSRLAEEGRRLAAELGVRLDDPRTAAAWGTYGPHVRLHATFVEIYNEQLRDLLSGYARVEGLCMPRQKAPGPGDDFSPDNLRIVESLNPVTRDREKVTEFASSVCVRSLDDVVDLLRHGNGRRTVAETNMNETSSRSHAILTLTMHTVALEPGMLCPASASGSAADDDSDSASVSGAQELLAANLGTRVLPKSSKIHLIDLAGSERQALTGTKGQQLKEACAINSSLFCLGNVINALVANQLHVPYRNSKLTYLLSDSLGGNSLTLTLACIAPSLGHFDETLSTLRFADRAKMVRTNAKANVDKNILVIQELEARVLLLTQLVEQCRLQHGPLVGGPDQSEVVAQSLELLMRHEAHDASCQCPEYFSVAGRRPGFFSRLAAAFRRPPVVKFEAYPPQLDTRCVSLPSGAEVSPGSLGSRVDRGC